MSHAPCKPGCGSGYFSEQNNNVWEVFSSSPSSTLRKGQNNRNIFHSEKSMSCSTVLYREGSSPKRGITLKSSTRKTEVKAGKLSTNVCKCILECQLIVLVGNPGTTLAQGMLKSGSQEGLAEADTVCFFCFGLVWFGCLVVFFVILYNVFFHCFLV